MAERSRIPANLRGGLVLLVALAAIAIAAPLLATDLPWIARDGRGLSFPAFGALVETVPVGLPDSDGRAVLRAPIPHGPNRVDLRATLLSPRADHWLGTDHMGLLRMFQSRKRVDSLM